MRDGVDQNTLYINETLKEQATRLQKEKKKKKVTLGWGDGLVCKVLAMQASR